MRTATVLWTVVLAFTLATGSANASSVIPGFQSGLFNTGLTANGTPLDIGDGQIDGNYIISATNIPDAISLGIVNLPARTYFNAAYAPENTMSRWISYWGDGGDGAGFMDLTTEFSLSGYDHKTAKLTGLWGTDNEGEIFLNGTSTGITLTGTGQFRSLSPFEITSGFGAGLNTLTMRVTNTGGVTAGRFDDLLLTAVVPLPAAAWLFLSGLGALLVAGYRRRGSLA